MTQFQIPTSAQTVGPASQIRLRDYQVEAVEAIRDAIARDVGSFALQLPTGMGKTVVFGSAGKEVGYPVLVLAHRDELLDQAADKFREIDPGVSVGKVKADQNQWYAEVVVASVQTLYRGRRLDDLRAVLRERPFRLAVVDEAHHATADSYQQIIGVLRGYGVPILGVSATLERGDGSGLGGTFEELIYEKPILWGIEHGYLSDIRGIQIKLKDAEFGRMRVSRGDFQNGQSGRMLSDAGAPVYAVKAFREHAADRKAILFTPTVELANEMADAFREAGIASEAVSGETPTDERKRIYRQLRSGETRVVCNAMVLTEGFDEPSVDCVIVARPTLSRPLYVQMIGRGTRQYPGKADCLVIDLVGATDRLNLVTVANLFGMPSAWMANGEMTVAQAVTAQATQQAEQQGQQERLRELEAIRLDLFTQRKFNWVRTAAKDGERYVLTTGDGMVMLHLADEEAGLWNVVHQPRRGEVTMVAQGLDLGYAQGTAEDYVRQQGASVLNDREARWRAKPASPKQIGALGKWGVKLIVRQENGRQVAWLMDEPDVELTAGRASDLLTETIAAKKAKAATA